MAADPAGQIPFRDDGFEAKLRPGNPRCAEREGGLLVRAPFPQGSCLVASDQSLPGRPALGGGQKLGDGHEGFAEGLQTALAEAAGVGENGGREPSSG